MSAKAIFGLISIILTIICYIPYFYGISRGKTHPHVFTWLTWVFSCGVAAAAQYSDHAGPGTLSNLSSTALAGIVVLLCLLQKADWSIVRSDWIAFLGGIAILELWSATNNALFASIFATAIDVFAYYPTFRKSWYRPFDEMVSFYLIANLKHATAIAAMMHYSWTTTLMPATALGINTLLIGLLLRRRHILAGLCRSTVK